MFSNKTSPKSKKAIPNACSYSALDILKYICIVSVPPDWNICEKKSVGSKCELPAVKSKAADSPTIRPIPSIVPVIIPGIALGNIIVLIICHLVVPIPIAAIL